MKPEEIKAYRAALGLTQAQLARKLGKAPNSIARWERGELKPGSPKILRLAFKGLETEVRDKKVRANIKQMKKEIYANVRKTNDLLGRPNDF